MVSRGGRGLASGFETPLLLLLLLRLDAGCFEF